MPKMMGISGVPRAPPEMAGTKLWEHSKAAQADDEDQVKSTSAAAVPPASESGATASSTSVLQSPAVHLEEQTATARFDENIAAEGLTAPIPTEEQVPLTKLKWAP
jgi:hypothetical protein